MRGPIYTELTPIVRRQRRVTALRAAAAGLLAGSLAGVGLGLGRWLLGWPVPSWAGVSLPAAGLVVGAVLALARRPSWRAAAAAVDTYYRLKDRTTTALAFLTKSPLSVFHELQVHDARRHLTAIDPGQVVPLRVPRPLPYALAALAAAVALFVWPLGPRPASAGTPEAIPGIVEVAEEIEADLRELEELARAEQDPELLKLVREMRAKVEEMKQPGTDLREALAKLSEMQAALAAQQNQDVGVVDEQLQSLGEAMSPAATLEGAAKALQEGKFDKAAGELEKLDNPPADPREARAAHDKMKQAAKEMRGKKLTQLSKAVDRMADGLKGGDKKQMQQGAQDIARQARDHERRRRINRLLALEQERLNDCKSRCQNAYLSWLDQQRKNQNQGSQNSSSSSSSQSQSSKSSGSKQGPGGGGNPLGNKTSLSALQNLQEIEGRPADGDGTSEVEKTKTESARQQATRPYRDVYSKYRRLSDAVLDSEPIPLGHRQTIRRYFELIHPQNLDGEK